MEIKTNPMERVKMLPENFDGLVRFTNWSDEDFTAKYNSKEYLIPANSTVVLSPLMPDRSPIELLNICKKLALDLATREWGKTQWYKDQLKRERNVDGSPRGYGMSGASTYSIEDPKFAALIEKGLYVYPTAKAKISDMPRPKLEERLSRDPEGRLNTKAVKQGAGLQDTIDEFAKEK
jgi:hypothetical protein